MIKTGSLQHLDKHQILQDFAGLIDKDRRATAVMLAYIAEIDRRKLYLEHAFPSMFAFCTKRFRMSEAIAAKRIRAGRTAYDFPCIFGMVARGELHLSGVHQLAGHLTEDNHEEVLQRARHKSMREIEQLIASIAPKPDVPSSIRALPTRKTEHRLPIETSHPNPSPPRASNAIPGSPKPRSRSVPLAPRRYKLQVTIGQETRDKLSELQALLSHQIPDGDPAKILDRAALPHGKSSFTTGYRTEGAERTTSTTSSSAAEATINTRPTWSTESFSWQRDATPRPTMLRAVDAES